MNQGTPVFDRGASRTAVVAGGNSGIGFAVAEGLGKMGYKIWIAGKDTKKGAAAAAQLRPLCPAGVEFLPLDLMLFAKVEQFLHTLKSQLGGRLDALVLSTGANNSERVVSADGLEAGWATQFLGRYLLTEALTPELSNSDGGRIVFVSSRAPKTPQIFEDDLSLESKYNVMTSIGQAQSAAALYVQLYAAKHPNGPSINAGVPGVVRGTGIRRSLTGLDKALMALSFALLGTSADRAAKNFIALTSDPALKGVSGYSFPQPEDIRKRFKLAYTQDQLAMLQRVLAKYSANKSALVSA